MMDIMCWYRSVFFVKYKVVEGIFVSYFYEVLDLEDLDLEDLDWVLELVGLEDLVFWVEGFIFIFILEKILLNNDLNLDVEEVVIEFDIWKVVMFCLGVLVRYCFW